jgi:polyhydroxybutyrate depolymerase
VTLALPLRLVLLPLVLLPLSGCADECGGEAACSVWRGEYHAFPPADWDGERPLPVVMLFHGAGGSPEGTFESADVMEAFSDGGVLLVLPRGRRGGWGVFGVNVLRRDEVQFAERVLDDAADRWSVDPRRVYASGFSVGSSVVSALGCHSDRFAAISPTSGGFWERTGRHCPAAPVPVLRTHGESDRTWPVDGQTFVPGLSQGAAADDVAFWRGHNGCGESVLVGPTTYTDRDGAVATVDCVTWTDCDAEVRQCLHAEGHRRVEGWVERDLDWMMQFAQ